MIIPIDADCFYETRNMYAGQYEIRLHFLDKRGTQQDVLTYFPQEPEQGAVLARLDNIKTAYNAPVVAIPPEIRLSDYSPKYIHDLMEGKIITEETTWEELLFNGSTGTGLPTEEGKIR